ncbi:MAG: BatD family protein [Bacteroidota bacterium]
MAQKFTASASRTKVAVGETFQISYVLGGNGSDFRAPALNEFNVYSGPNQSTSMSIVNGNMSQSITLSYIISAKKEGKFTIGPASISTGGATVQSNSLIIEAVKGSAGNQNNNQSSQNPSASNTENTGDNLFVRTSVSKTKAYMGEQITVTHKVYTRYQLRGFRDIKFPDYTGFWAQDMPGSQQIQLTNENIDGIGYQVAELKRSYIFAQRSGKLEIEPMVVECVVRKQSNRQPRDIFEQFFGGGYEDAVLSVKSKTIAIEILPLPDANKPSDFSGAVGDYSFKAQLSKDKVKANEAVNLTITLSGNGNIKLVDPLKINFPEDFETYDPKTSEKITAGTTGVSGSKTFDYLIIPRHEGEYKIDQIHFSYFDPNKKEYITLPSPDFILQVEKGDQSSATVVGANTRSKEELKVLGSDIRYIKTNAVQLKPKRSYFFGSLLFYLLLIFPFLAFIGFIILYRKNREQNRDVIAVKSRKATKMAKKQLSLAEKHLKTNSKEPFYVEIFKALYGYISNKLNIPVADLNKEHISSTLKSKNVTKNTIHQLITTLDNCEYAHYAPNAASGNLKDIYNSTVELITKIEDEIRS